MKKSMKEIAKELSRVSSEWNTIYPRNWEWIYKKQSKELDRHDSESCKTKNFTVRARLGPI